MIGIEQLELAAKAAGIQGPWNPRNTFVFRVEKRQSSLSKSGFEHVLTLAIDGCCPLPVKAWSNPPSDAKVKAALEIMFRSFEIYHVLMRLPGFELIEKKTTKPNVAISLYSAIKNP